jgi:thioredoxin reductase (NADPH)
MSTRDVIIVGAGPSGLAAAIACARRGLDYEVLERGVLVNAIFNFPTNMVFFTTPELLEIGGMPLVSPFEKPTRLEALRYYRRIADAFHLNVSLRQPVVSIEQGEAVEGAVLEVRSERPGGRGERVQQARAVILAVGYYDQPNRLDVPGEGLPHVSHFYKEAHAYYGQRVVVVGGANSAAEAALELYRSGARVTLVHREQALSSSIKYWVLPDIQNRIKEGAVAARFGATVRQINESCVQIEQDGRVEDLPAEAVLLLTGYHTDRAFLQRCGVRVDPVTLAPCHDSETLETNVPNVFLAGGVVVGLNSAPVFIENGRLHGDKVVSLIAGRLGR